MSWSAEVDRIETSFVTGRLRQDSHSAPASPPIELWIDEVLEATEVLGPEEPEPAEFRIALPSFCFDAQQHEVQIRVGGTVYTQTFLSHYRGFIDSFADNLISGWAVDHARPKTPVQIEIEVNGVTVDRVAADIFRDDLQARHGFHHRLRETPETQRSFVLQARFAGTDIEVQHSPVLSLSGPRVVRVTQKLNAAFHYLEQRLLWDGGGRGHEPRLTVQESATFADLLLNGSDVADLLELRHRFLRDMQQRATQDYARRDFTILGVNYPDSVPRRSPASHRDRPVDILVPLYAGLNDTERCLHSVLRSSAGCRYNLICILDDSALPGVAALVHKLAKAHPQITVIEHGISIGFAESVNRAMLRNRDRDVLVLQADCEVSGDWLSRLQAAAYEGAGAGLVNPLTDHGDYLSYPALGLELPPDAPLELLDASARTANAGRTVPIPAALNFCLFIRRGCLDDLGFFHNDHASGGYFTEKYFSVNAAAQGWRTVAATNVFVKCRGAMPFADRDTDDLVNAREAFEVWCPFYLDSVTDFLVDDPLLPARRELDLARLEALGVDNFCFISHGGGGGTERHLQDLGEALAMDGVGAITLFCLPDGRVSVASAALESIENLRYRVHGELDRLVRDLARLRVKHLHFHTNIDVPREIFQLPERLALPFDVTVHDYAWFCPRVNLTNHSGAYCGEPPLSVCETCAGGGVAALTEMSRGDLARARRVFCPTEDVRDRMQRHFDLPNLEVRAHMEWIASPEAREDAPSPGERVRVAIIGRLSGHKGLNVLRQCAAHALEWALPLDFVVVGSTSDDSRFSGLTNIEITGAYRESEVDELVDRRRVRVAFLPSTWPETYSYTLSIALRNGLVPVAFDLGAIAERVRRAGLGILMPLGASAAEINQALLRAAGQRAPLPRNLGKGYLNMLRDYYGLA